MIERRLKRARINLKQHIALFHRTAFDVILCEQITGYRRADLRVHKTIQRANPFRKNQNVGGGQRDDLDF